MPKAKIRPPRTPRGESARVTIGNLRNEIAALLARVDQVNARYEDAVRMRDDWQRNAFASERGMKEAQQELVTQKAFSRANISRLEECQAKLASTEQRFEGYRQAVAEIMGKHEAS